MEKKLTLQKAARAAFKVAFPMLSALTVSLSVMDFGYSYRGTFGFHGKIGWPGSESRTDGIKKAAIFIDSCLIIK